MSNAETKAPVVPGFVNLSDTGEPPEYLAISEIASFHTWYSASSPIPGTEIIRKVRSEGHIIVNVPVRAFAERIAQAQTTGSGIKKARQNGCQAGLGKGLFTPTELSLIKSWFREASDDAPEDWALFEKIRELTREK
jgi:hypothetical protein